MKNTSMFDVLVVYNSELATSASSNAPNTNLPFSRASGRTNYNDAYAYFLQMCLQNNLNAAFSTSSDITGAGMCSSHWLFKKDKWIKVDRQCYSTLIFDKFSPTNDLQRLRRNTLFSNEVVQPFNASSLFALFFDKLKTYEFLKEFAIPTVAVKSRDVLGIKVAIDKLNKLSSLHPANADFSRDIVIKDRFGAGGNKIYLIGAENQLNEIIEILEKNENTSFIIQPFTHYKEGHHHEGHFGFIDTRVIFLGGKIIQTYIRVAKEEEFRCNEHKGATLLYIRKSQIPPKVLKLAGKIAGILHEDGMVFALDFIISDRGNVYFVEGNSGPGIDWNLSIKKNELMAKKLIRQIVTALSQRVARK